MEEHGYGQYDEKRRQSRTETCAQGTLYPVQLVAYEDAHVYGQHAGTTLRHGYYVEKVLTADPPSLVYHFRFDYRYHGVAAAEGEQSYLEKRLETIRINAWY